MTILGIETSGETASVALCQDERLIALRAFPSRLSLCRRLTSEIAELLQELREGEQVDAIAVGRGPGSFTSLRIGIITAKALAQALRLPLAGVTTTEAIAWPFSRLCGHTICVVVPAWKSALYVAAYYPEPSNRLREVIAPQTVQPDALVRVLAELEGSLLFLGQATAHHMAKLRQALGERLTCSPAILDGPLAHHVVAVACSRFANSKPDDPLTLKPLYVVPSQAERTAGIDLGLAGTECE
ncbi:MAG: tRNA (adenosine(37)-N6)-threonylcarbamoyltransferase complex dimerization subunit type 1 TsaB [Candidatus Zipacnadales bacterium]